MSGLNYDKWADLDSDDDESTPVRPAPVSQVSSSQNPIQQQQHVSPPAPSPPVSKPHTSDPLPPPSAAVSSGSPESVSEAPAPQVASSAQHSSSSAAAARHPRADGHAHSQSPMSAASAESAEDDHEHVIQVPQHPQPPGVMPGIVQIPRALLEEAQKKQANALKHKNGGGHNNSDCKDPNSPNPQPEHKNHPPTPGQAAEDPRDYRRLGHEVFYAGRRIYGWEQDLEEVRLRLTVPPGVTSARQHLRVEIEPDHLRVGLRGGDRWFLDEALEHLVVPDESLWTLELNSSNKSKNNKQDNKSGGDDDVQSNEGGGELEIQLHKAELGQVWLAALRRHPKMGPAEEQLLRKRLLLERFGRENPGFDFSQAVVNGRAPEVREFMGGVDRNRFLK